MKNHDLGARQRLAASIAHQCGLYVIPIEQVEEWKDRKKAHEKLARDYKDSDPILERLHDGRCEGLTQCINSVHQVNGIETIE
jgi:hypothetical protein